MNIETTILLSGAFTVICIGVILLLMYHKISSALSRLNQKLPRELSNTFAQTEALLSIQLELKFEHALPPTRGWAASPDFLRNVMEHALSRHPNIVVECSSGISTVVLARCMEINGQGHVYSLENDPEFAERTRALLQRHNLVEFATVLDAPLVPTSCNEWSGSWYSHHILPADLPIDLLVIDGPPWFTAKLARYPAVPMLYKRLSSEAAIYLDDASREDEQTIAARWLKEFPQLKQIVTSVCEKGCAGFQRLPENIRLPKSTC